MRSIQFALPLAAVFLAVPVFTLAQPKAEKPQPPAVIGVVVSTTLGTDGEQFRQFVFDGSVDTYFASAKSPGKTDTLTLQFDQPVLLKSVKVVTGKPQGGNEIAEAALSGSADKMKFEQIGKFERGIATAKPDKKLAAIRIEFHADAKEAVAIREVQLETEPPLSTFKNPVEISADSSEAPELKDWFDGVARLCESQYDRICEELKADGYTPPKRINMTLKKDYDGVAYAQGNRIVGSVKYFSRNKSDVGAFVHETAHCVQQYRGRNPGWLVEGVADYVRFFRYEPNKPKPLPPERAKYDGSYRTTAAFLDYIIQTHDKEAVRKLNDAMRKGKYAPEIWKQITGKTLEDLGRDWQKSLAK